MRKELRALTGLRFLAAFYVFVFHLHLYGLLPSLPWYVINIINEGTLGVTVFFVLSGMLLTYSHLKDYPTAVFKGWRYYFHFMIKRIARIYPVLILAIVLLVVFNKANHTNQPDFPKIVILDALLLNAWLPQYALAWFGGGSWSVSAEMFFYILFPLLLPLLLRIPTKNKLYILLIVLVLLSSVPGLIMAYYFSSHKFNLYIYSFVYCLPIARVSEFICGSVTAILVFRHNWKIQAIKVLGAIVVLALYLTKFGPPVIGHMGHNLVVVPTLILIVGYLSMQPKDLFTRLLESNLMVYLGRISYSFYIWQIVLSITKSSFLQNLTFCKNSPVLFVSIIFVTNLTLAIISYHLIETRSHKFIIKIFSTKKHSTLENAA